MPTGISNGRLILIEVDKQKGAQRGALLLTIPESHYLASTKAAMAARAARLPPKSGAKADPRQTSLEGHRQTCRAQLSPHSIAAPGLLAPD
jgi:hypothetical protein